MLRAGFEPATRRLGGDNGNVAGPQQRSCRGRGVRSGADLNRSAAAEAAHAFPDNRAAPARDRTKANPPGLEPGPARLELAVLPLHHGFVQADDPARTGLSGLATRCSTD
jgi:hypothetical protein